MLRFGGLRGNVARASVHPKAVISQKVAWFASEKKSPPDNAGSTSREEGGENFKAKWWRPDPVTGVWVPEETKEQIDAVELREQHRFRNEPTASLDEQAWWSSMEEIPDRVYPM